MTTLVCFGLGYSADHYIGQFGDRLARIVGTVRGAERAALLNARFGGRLRAFAFDGSFPTPEVKTAIAEADLAPWHDFQRWLAAGECAVVLPWVRSLTKLITVTTSVRLRRDYSQLLRAIKAHALLHRQHRKRDRKGAIIATINDDYAAIRTLMADLLASAAELRVREIMIETVNAVQAKQGEVGATVHEIAEHLRRDRSATYRRLQTAQKAGYIVNSEQRKGWPGRYQVIGEPPAAVGELLPSVEELLRQRRADLERARQRTSREHTQKSMHKVHRGR